MAGRYTWAPRTVLPGVHANPVVLIDAGGGFSQDVDVVAGLLHVEQEVDRDSGEGKHRQPDEGQDVRHDDKLWKEGVQCVRSQRCGASAQLSAVMNVVSLNQLSTIIHDSLDKS